ncbi:unnamed protein product [Pichia kudriavzevii]|uniref:Cell surface mannoprotein MP65 n=1 Tax=Pichia kudriavzevii TaxID=4909 RepID=A0A099NZ18_PICKU|nr:hypothetical protein JL09_g3586 [Pichia kudriavzevii]
MRSSLLLLLATAVAIPMEHVHHAHQRRDTIYVTDVVMQTQFQQDNVLSPSTDIQDPQTSSETSPESVDSILQDTQTTLATSTTSSAVAESTWSVEDQSSTSTSVSSGVASTSSLTSSSTSSSASSSASSSSDNGIGIAYSPYTSSGSCKSLEEVQSDFAQLPYFPIIRVYAPDCNVISNLLSTLSSNQQIFAGLFYKDTIEKDIDSLYEQLNGDWSRIYTVNVGNEWVNSGTYDAQTVVDTVKSARTYLQSKGYTGKVVTVDTVPAYENNPTLCDASDYAAVNQHAFWNGDLQPSDSGKFIQDTITQMESLCGKDVLITESGWPTQGTAYGTCQPGKSEQETAIQSIRDACADKVIFFTAFNDLWKQPGQNGVEPYWGIY